MLRGLQVAVDDAVRVRGRETVGDAEADLDGLPPRESAAERAVPQLFAQGLALEQLGDREGDAGLEPTSWMSRMFGCERAATARASRSNRARATVSSARVSERTLIGDFAPEPRVAGSVNLAHPAGADRRQDFIGPEASSLAECQR